MPRPLPSPPPPQPHAAPLPLLQQQQQQQWYAARASEELARCGLFDEGLEMQRGELAAVREALESDYRAFKVEVEAVAGLSGAIGGEAGSAAAIRARQGALRAAKAALEARISEVNADILAWNTAVEFSKERAREARALLEEAGAPGAFDQRSAQQREARLCEMGSLEVAAAAKRGRQLEGAASLGFTLRLQAVGGGAQGLAAGASGASSGAAL